MPACLWNVGSKTAGRKRTPGRSRAVHRVGEPLGDDPGRADELERPRRPAAFRDVRAFEQHRARIHDRGVERRHVRRRHDPRQPGLVVSTSRAASRHRHDLELGADAEVIVEEPRQLADRHAVPHRDRILADERLEPALEHRAFDATPPIGFGRSQTMTLMPCLRAAIRQLAIV